MSIVPIVCDVKDLQPLIRSMSHHRLFLPIQHSGQLHKSALTPLCSNILADHQSQGGPVYDLGLAFIMPNFTLQIELVCHGAWAISFFSISRNDAMTVDILKRFSLLRKGSSKLKRIPFTEILIRPLRFLKVVLPFNLVVDSIPLSHRAQLHPSCIYGAFSMVSFFMGIIHYYFMLDHLAQLGLLRPW